jgi:hypothetical protein
METVMCTRLMVIAAAASMLGTSAFAEPPKPHGAPATQPATPPAQVVLASADQIRDPVPTAEQVTPPVKRPRVGRATTCRCGDQQASSDEQ